MMSKLFLVSVVTWVCFPISSGRAAQSADFCAYYTKIDSGQDWEKSSRTGRYADVVVNCGTFGEMVFWCGSSYLPYWKTEKGQWYVPEIVERRGDGKAPMPDRHNRYSYIRIIEATAEQVVVDWRYVPDFSNIS
jgi:hypothetical protein